MGNEIIEYYVNLIFLFVLLYFPLSTCYRQRYNILKFFNVAIDEENLLSLLIGDLLTMIYCKKLHLPNYRQPL